MHRIERTGLDYQAYFCEENVWRLLSRPEYMATASWAVIVSNVLRDVVLMRQVSGRPLDGLIHWDYHVFAVVTDPIAGRLALDFDSELPFPSPLSSYLEDTFPRDVQRAYEPRFRVIRGGEYVSCLVSDRSHMRKADGSWVSPPPPWAAPGAGSEKSSDFMKWTDMLSRSPGIVYDRARMAAFARGGSE